MGARAKLTTALAGEPQPSWRFRNFHSSVQVCCAPRSNVLRLLLARCVAFRFVAISFALRSFHFRSVSFRSACDRVLPCISLSAGVFAHACVPFKRACACVRAPCACVLVRRDALNGVLSEIKMTDVPQFAHSRRKHQRRLTYQQRIKRNK